MDNESEEVIKQQMLETRASLAEKLETLEQQVVGTVEAVKETFDLWRHVREHPWLMVAGSVAAGYAAGRLLDRAEAAARNRLSSGAVPGLSTPSQRTAHERDGGADQPLREEAAASARAVLDSASQGVLGQLGRKFDTEINKLKGLALGTILGVVRDLIADSAPPQLRSRLADIIDSATVKLGGQPIEGPVLNMFQHDFAGRGEVQQGRSFA